MPVVVIGAGPTGVTAATLLAQNGVETLVLDRWADVYPSPARSTSMTRCTASFTGSASLTSSPRSSRPALGLRLLDPAMTVLAEFQRDPARTRHGHPEANMFDQPEFEALLRTNLERHPPPRCGQRRGHRHRRHRAGRSRICYTDRGDGSTHEVQADYVLGCDGANFAGPHPHRGACGT